MAQGHSSSSSVPSAAAPRPPSKTLQEVLNEWLDAARVDLPPLHQVHPLEHLKTRCEELAHRMKEAGLAK